MNFVLKGKKLLSMTLLFAIILSIVGPVPIQANATNAVSADINASNSNLGKLDVDPVPTNHLRVHYNRADGLYNDFGLWAWDNVAEPSTGWPLGATAFSVDKMDSYGAYIDVPLTVDAKKVGFLIVNRSNQAKDAGDKAVAISSPAVNEIWIQEGSDLVSYYEPVALPANTVRVHYVRDDQNQSAYGLWLWDQVEAPSTDWPTGASAFTADHVDRYGGYVDIPLADNATKMSFIVIDQAGNKDGGDRSFTLLDRYNQLWIRQGDNAVYVSPYWEMPTGLVSGEILSESHFLLTFTMTDSLLEAELKNAITITDKNGAAVTVNQVQLKDDKKTALISADIQLGNAPFNITYMGKTVSAVAGWRMIDEMYNYEGNDLGATYDSGNVTLKLWAPQASTVVASVYDKNDAARFIGSKDLMKGDKGVWTATIQPSDFNDPGMTDLKGYFYQYQVTNDGVTKNVLDPYAKSMAEFRVNTKGEVGPDGDAVGKAAIVDLSETNPAGNFDFAQIDGYEKREDAIIWEAHIRDFTSDPSIEGDLNARWGSYDAFKDKLDYIKSLGVTHIQLLPVMAWYFGDEAKMDVRENEYSAQDNEYNWGYDPHSYFSPDGAYSNNAADPALRVKELKGLIDAIHEAGMGVLLDVVYTHMAKADFLNDIVPNYYAFQDANGNNIGGFGNNLATSHKMAEKLMVDSVKYWFDEYKIDGMRFDMMGDATYDAVQHAYDAASAINPNALFIGEGWQTFGGAASDPSLAGKGADQLWMDKTDDVGVFSDEIRNELKSGFGSEGEPRFITGGARDINMILNNIKAQPGNTPADDPGDMVQYIEAHDNLPLYDVIAQSIKKDPSIAVNDLEIHKRVRLGNLLILTSQGTAFLHAGQEYGRTKQWLGAGLPEQKYHVLSDVDDKPFGYFVHDSYDSSDAINKFDWQKATNAVQYPVNHVTKEYTAGLIELRKHTDAFRLGDKDLVDSNVTLIEASEIKASDLIIAYKNKATDGTGNYYVFMNADNKSRTLSLSENLTAGTVLVDNDEAGTEAVSVQSGFVLTANSITLEPLTAVIIKLDVKQPQPPVEETRNPGAAIPDQDKVTVTTADMKLLEKAIIAASTTQEKQVTIIVTDAKATEVSIPAAAFKQAKAAGVAIAIQFEGVTIILPSGAIDEATLAGSEQIIVSKQVVSDAEAEKIKKGIVDLDAGYKAIGRLFNFSIASVNTANVKSVFHNFKGKVQVKVTLTPEERKAITDKRKAGVYYVGEDGKLEFRGGKFSDTAVTFSTEHFSNYIVMEYTKTFADVQSGWAKPYVELLASRHITTGVDADQFNPGGKVTRAEFAVFLGRALGLEEAANDGIFTDVGAGTYYSGYVNTMSKLGLITGNSDGTFGPNNAITREQLAAMVIRAYSHATGVKASDVKGASEASFTDLGKASSYSTESIRAAKALGIIDGTGTGNFEPAGDATREQAAKMIIELLGNME